MSKITNGFVFFSLLMALSLGVAFAESEVAATETTAEEIASNVSANESINESINETEEMPVEEAETEDAKEE